MKARRGTRHVRRLGADEQGSFVVLEAVLVAMLVLTAILFFTTVQRPSGGADQGGLDLAAVAADTLQLLQARSFVGQDLESWIVNVTEGDAAGDSLAATVDDFMLRVLPTGAHYILRLDNGVSNLTVLPHNRTEDVHAGRASQVMFLPQWAAFRNDTVTVTVSPGQVVPNTAGTAYDLLKAWGASGTHYRCYRSPIGTELLQDEDLTNDTWAGHWRTTPGARPWKADVGATSLQVPTDLLYGRWRVYNAANCSGTAVVVNVVPPGFQELSGTLQVSPNVIDIGDVRFTSQDIGKTLTGPGIPSVARIVSISTSDATRATFSSTLPVVGTGLGPAVPVTLAADSTFLPYALQLVVWFGA